MKKFFKPSYLFYLALAFLICNFSANNVSASTKSTLNKDLIVVELLDLDSCSTIVDTSPVTRILNEMNELHNKTSLGCCGHSSKSYLNFENIIVALEEFVNDVQYTFSEKNIGYYKKNREGFYSITIPLHVHWDAIFQACIKYLETVGRPIKQSTKRKCEFARNFLENFSLDKIVPNPNNQLIEGMDGIYQLYKQAYQGESPEETLERFNQLLEKFNNL